MAYCSILGLFIC